MFNFSGKKFLEWTYFVKNDQTQQKYINFGIPYSKTHPQLDVDSPAGKAEIENSRSNNFVFVILLYC